MGDSPCSCFLLPPHFLLTISLLPVSIKKKRKLESAEKAEKKKKMEKYEFE
jgi:hypothetical protein